MFFTASFSIPVFFLVLNPSVLHSFKKKKIHFSSLLSKYPFFTSHFAYPTLQCVSSWEFFNRFDNSLLHLSISFQQWQQSLASKKKWGTAQKPVLRPLTFTLESSFNTMYFGRLAIFPQCFYAFTWTLAQQSWEWVFCWFGVFFQSQGVRCQVFLQVFYFASS